MKSLFHVEVSYDIVVFADGESEAEREARRAVAIDDEEPTILYAQDYDKDTCCSLGWTEDCIPYGGAGKTIKELNDDN